MRVTNAVPSRKRRKMVLARAKGFYGCSSKNIRTAYDAVDKAHTPCPQSKVRSTSFPPLAKTAFAPLLLVSKRNPLRWVFVWEGKRF